MTLIVRYFDVGLSRNPSLSQLNAVNYAVQANSATEATFRLMDGEWAGFSIRVTGQDFRFVSGVPWSGAIATLEIVSPTGLTSLSFSHSDDLDDLGVDLGSFWEILTTQGARALQAEFQGNDVALRGGEFKIYGSSGNDNIMDWSLSKAVSDRTIDAGAGDDLIERVSLAHDNETYGTINLGDGNDVVSNSRAQILGGAGEDEISATWQGFTGGGYITSMIGGDDDDVFYNSSEYWAFADGGPGYDVEYLTETQYGITISSRFSEGVEEYVFSEGIVPRAQQLDQVFSIQGLIPAKYVSLNPVAPLHAEANESGDFRTLEFEGWSSVSVLFRPYADTNIVATEGDDSVQIEAGRTSATRRVDNITIDTASGNDTVLIEDGGGHEIRLGSGDDSVVDNTSYSPNTSIFGEQGEDVFRALYFFDRSGRETVTYDGGSDFDRIEFLGDTDVLLDVSAEMTSGRLIGFESFRTGAGMDTLIGTDADEWFSAGLGRNDIDGGAGRDTLDYSRETGAVAVMLAQDALSVVTVAGVVRDAVQDIEDVVGGHGDDDVVGDGRDNTFRGMAGNDTFIGGSGTDTFVIDTHIADLVVDEVTGTSALRLISEYGADVIHDDVEQVELLDGVLTFAQLSELALIPKFIGDDSANLLTGTTVSELFIAGGGNDWINSGGGSDTIDGGAGFDMLSFSGLPELTGRTNTQFRLSIDLSEGLAESHDGSELVSIENVERVTGTIFADLIRGDAHDNQLRGLGDYDWFIATTGNDTIDGGNGQDMVSFVEWQSTVANVVSNVFSSSGMPPSAAQASGILLDLADSSKNSNLASNISLTSVERVTGSGRQDVFYGDDRQNDFRGLGDYDWFVSSTGGRERYFGGDGLDTVTYFNASSGIVANLSNGATVNGQETGYGSGGVAALDLYFEIENLVGSRFGDELRGSSERNQLNGLEGDDIIFGYGGVDYIKGGLGNDYINGGSGSDYALFTGNADDYTLVRGSGSESNRVTVVGLDGTDTLVDVEYFRFDDADLSIWSL